MNRRTPPDIWLDKKRPTKEVLAELGLERRWAYMLYGPRGTKPGHPAGPPVMHARRRAKSRPCPCCGEGTILLRKAPLRFGPVTQTLFNAIRDSEYGLTITQLVEKVYGHQSTHLECPERTLYVLIGKLNKKLKTVGLGIKHLSYGGGYFLVER